MKCWICGDEGADTREHRTKASDLRSVFGVPTQGDPLYLHTAQRRNIKVGSLKADVLKFKHRICLSCNSARTQPHDRAWELLSAALRSRNLSISPGQTLRFNRIFPHDTRREMCNVHLYFVKVFGCQIADGDIPIDIAPFARAILEEKPHPNLYLSFGRMAALPTSIAGASDVHAELLNGQVAFTSWFYQIDDLSVNVMFAVPGEQRQGLANAWHPSLDAKRLTFKAFGK